MKTEKLTIFDKIRLWWKFEGRYYHTDFKDGVKNLIRWFPTIWKDRDWDTHYIWVLMMEKLKNQSNYIGKKDRHTSAKRDAEIMMTCVRLMEKIKEEYYSSEFMEYHDSDYNFVDTENPEYKELEIVEKSENYNDYFKKYPLTYKKVIKSKLYTDVVEGDPEENKKRIALLMGHENHRRAKRILFLLMEKNIEKWWD